MPHPTYVAGPFRTGDRVQRINEGYQHANIGECGTAYPSDSGVLYVAWDRHPEDRRPCFPHNVRAVPLADTHADALLKAFGGGDA